MKALLRSTPVQAALGGLLAAYMRLVAGTTRWDVRGLEHIEPIWRGMAGVVGCVWHARVLMTIAGWPRDAQPATVLISRSPDGEFVARAARGVNISVVRGSARNPKKDKGKGGESAFRTLIEHVRGGGCACITPDGPRGPRMRASVGAVRLARAAEAPLAPYAWSTKNRIVFKSWDRFMLPLPFGRGVIVWGPILPPPADGDAETIEATRAALEDALNAATREADLAVGFAGVDPAPPRGARRGAPPQDPAPETNADVPGR